MDSKKYIGMDVHQATISLAVRDTTGKLVMESIIQTKASTILEFIQGLRGNLWVTFEVGSSAAWLYDLLQPHVAKVTVCNPRKNALLKAGNKNDQGVHECSIATSGAYTFQLSAIHTLSRTTA